MQKKKFGHWRLRNSVILSIIHNAKTMRIYALWRLFIFFYTFNWNKHWRKNYAHWTNFMNVKIELLKRVNSETFQEFMDFF